MSLTCINEPVEVRVDFCGKQVLPRAMHWNNKLYAIRNVNMIHSAYYGETKHFFFSVSDTQNYFKLELNTGTLEWKLIEMYAE